MNTITINTKRNPFRPGYTSTAYSRGEVTITAIASDERQYKSMTKSLGVLINSLRYLNGIDD